ncbi:MAG: protein TolR [Desulfuromonadaceae bacterium]|nr:protein TolR [Desulfuromonadaceae bacterium]
MNYKSSPRRSALAEINVTPFVDVMLVLLIIFMVTAPMLEKGVDVDLPQVEHAPNLAAAQEALIVSIDAERRLYVGRQLVESPEKMVAVLQQVLKDKKNKDVYLEADRTVPYERVVQVLAAVRRAGVTQLGMIATEPEP